MDDKTGNKIFKYRQQLTKIAHREQINLEIDLDDVQSFDEDIATSIANNTRRYTNIVLDVCKISHDKLFLFIICCLIYIVLMKFKSDKKDKNSYISLSMECLRMYVYL
jgi:hypothetical protein